MRRLDVRRRLARALFVSSGLCLAIGACGDPLLPANFQGPPAAAVAGNVVAPSNAGTSDATHPELTMAWLTSLNGSTTGSALVGQAVTFTRSTKLTDDWDIGLATPDDDAKLNVSINARNVRVAIGKVVYYDDLIADGRLDWSCQGSACDEVKAVSAEYLVYLDKPLTCDAEGGLVPRTKLAAGYHYYRLDNATPRELPANTALSFTIENKNPAAGDPTAALRAFANDLSRALGLMLLDGC